jgi:hypothetical protein
VARIGSEHGIVLEIGEEEMMLLFDSRKSRIVKHFLSMRALAVVFPPSARHWNEGSMDLV